MKLKLLVLLFLTFSVSYAQMKPVSITFRNGEILKGIGKTKAYTFKYKIDENAKAQEFEFSTIKSVEAEISYGEKVTYKFFQVKDSENFIAVKELVSGSKAELYTTSFSFNTGGMGMGGMGMSSQTVTNYYIKRPNEDKLTEMGAYSPLTNDLKARVKTYFSDCKSLIEKLENREFKVREGLEDIVTFYNKNCE
jgi:hypothetical protein